MKKSVKWTLTALICVLVFVGIWFLYAFLKEEYAPDRFADVSTDTSESVGSSSQDNEEQQDFTAPDFTVYDSEGKAVKLSDFRGRPVVVNFWASWCYYCKVEMPDFDKAYENHSDVEFMMINVTDGKSETIETAQEYVNGEGYKFPVYYDTTLEATQTYGASGLPMTFFINGSGQLVTYATGMLTADQLEQGLSMLKTSE
ncbi:MAG: TlpA family protein disulfide reductase [Ruminococcus sp.]|nr:TlpA family protein disulfide reductase [Ruminococcus sp.]